MNAEQKKQANREAQKRFYELHKEEVKAQSRKNYNENKAHILTQQREKIICECGGRYSRGKKLRHNRSKKHIKFLNK